MSVEFLLPLGSCFPSSPCSVPNKSARERVFLKKEGLISDPISRLFAFLQETNQRVYQKSLRSLVQACQEAGVEYLLTIKQLDLSHCKLQTIPEEVAQLTQLESLRLINNQLTTLPSSLFALSENLYSLELEGNEFRRVPEVVCQIAESRIPRKKYFELFLRDNPMEEVPKELRSVVLSLPCYEAKFT